MKVLLTNINTYLANSICFYKHKHTLVENISIEKITPANLNADIWFLGIHLNNNFFKEDNFKKLISTFSGKLCLCVHGDGVLYSQIFKQLDFLKDRFSCYIANKHTSISNLITDKVILHPNYVIVPPSTQPSSLKAPYVYFKGSLTGGQKFGINKNHRLEAYKKICNDTHTNYKFDIFCTKEQQNTYNYKALLQEESNIPIIKNLSENILVSKNLYYHELSNASASLCLPGNSLLCYRHIESFALKTLALSVPFSYETDYWLYKDYLDECCLSIAWDLSNLIEVCNEAIYNQKKYVDIINHAFDYYNFFYRLNSGNVYQQHIWNAMNQKLQCYNLDI